MTCMSLGIHHRLALMSPSLQMEHKYGVSIRFVSFLKSLLDVVIILMQGASSGVACGPIEVLEMFEDGSACVWSGSRSDEKLECIDASLRISNTSASLPLL